MDRAHTSDNMLVSDKQVKHGREPASGMLVVLGSDVFMDAR